jgi:hypothetical protein
MKIKSHLELTSETAHVQEQSVRDLAATRRPGRPQLSPPCCLTVVVLCVNGAEGLHMRVLTNCFKLRAPEALVCQA